MLLPIEERLFNCLACLSEEMLNLQHSTEVEYFCQECEELAHHKVDHVASENKLRILYSGVVLADSKQVCDDSDELLTVLCKRLPKCSFTNEELTPENIHLFI